MPLRIRLTVFAPSGMGAVVGEPEMVMELADGSVLQNLLDSFLERFGKELIGGSADYQRRHLANNVLIVVNSQVISQDEAQELPLRDNDYVTIIPPIAGG